MRLLKEEEIKSISVGDILYKKSRYNPKSKFRVQIVEILNDKEVMVKGLCESKKGKKKEAKPFKTYIKTLYVIENK